MVAHKSYTIETKGTSDVIDITAEVGEAVASSGVKEGIVVVFTTHSTASVTTIENEPNLLKDLSETLEGMVPSKHRYHHEKAWGEKNGYSHLRATLLGASLVLPIEAGLAVLGPWQQVVLVESDSQGRPRTVRCTVIGE